MSLPRPTFENSKILGGNAVVVNLLNELFRSFCEIEPQLVRFKRLLTELPRRLIERRIPPVFRLAVRACPGSELSGVEDTGPDPPIHPGGCTR